VVITAAVITAGAIIAAIITGAQRGRVGLPRSLRLAALQEEVAQAPLPLGGADRRARGLGRERGGAQPAVGRVAERHGELPGRDELFARGLAAREEQRLGAAMNQRPARGIEERAARVDARIGDERRGDPEPLERALPLGASEIGAAQERVKGVRIAVDARILKDAEARPAIPSQVRADLEIVVHPLAQTVLLGEADGRQRNQIALLADVEPGLAGARVGDAGGGAKTDEERDHAEREDAAPGRRRRGPARRSRPAGRGRRAPPLGPPGAGAGRHGRTGQQRELGHEADAPPAQQAERQRGQGGAQPPASRQRQRDQQRGGQEEERPVERPAGGPVLLQRAQARHAEVVGDVAQGARPGRRGQDERQQRRRHQRRPPRVDRAGRGMAGRSRARRRPRVGQRARRIEQQHGGRQEEAGVGVGPDHPRRDQQPERARAAGLRALEGQQRPRQAEEGHQVRPLDEARLGRPGRQRQHRPQQRRGRPAPAPDQPERGEGRQHQRGLQHHRGADPARPLRQRQHDLEEPGQVDLRLTGPGERQEIGLRDVAGLQRDLAQAQIEKYIGLVHGHQAAPGHEQHQRQKDPAVERRLAHGSDCSGPRAICAAPTARHARRPPVDLGRCR
jgi:hypothetical protein